MPSADRNYLRGARKRARLSQQELAFLLSTNSTTISKLENRQRSLPVHLFVGYCLLLDCHPCDLCPDLRHTFMEETAPRIRQLLTELEPIVTRSQAAKRDALELLLKRCD